MILENCLKFPKSGPRDSYKLDSYKINSDMKICVTEHAFRKKRSAVTALTS